MLISYSNNTEVLVCTPDKETLLIRDWFASHTGRDITDYDREKHNSILEISLSMKVWGY